MKEKFLQLILSSFIFAGACYTPGTFVQGNIAADLSSLKVGTGSESQFTERKDKTFLAGEKINVQVNVKGITILNAKIRLNVDLFLKKDNEVIGTDSNILGKDGLVKEVPGVQPTFGAGDGQALLNISITPPTGVTGEIQANITVKDLNLPGKISSFETSFTVK